MSETYLVFTDEAGVYNKRPNEKFRHSHPLYIRSNVRFSADDYRLFQNEIAELNEHYSIPVSEEIKWSDLWEIHKGKYRSEFLKTKSEDTLKGYYRRVFNRAVDKKSLEFIFTVTCVYTQTCYQSEEEVLKFHLQESMQRVNMDAQPNDFATIIMDELNPELKIIEDETGTTEFQESFKKYVSERRPQFNLLNEYDFDYCDSKQILKRCFS